MFSRNDFHMSISQETPLHWSANEGHLEICRLLLHNNADVEAKTEQ
jgi:ankyrin repeat protein